ncbi:MAG: hypothetical protein AUJ92_14935 [Armatimonadetes bacterium CG2_30_59_28]|nr:MAG: hypothetical protein AUJ92_14935 [Armatimonadetes bacterium CG2_30_59_28]
MCSDKLGKAGMAAAAFVGAIVFVWFMIGMLTLFGYLAAIGALIGAACVIIAIVVRFLQLKVRMLTFYGIFALVAALWAIALIPYTDLPSIVVAGLVVGVLAGLGLRATYLKRFRELTQPESPRADYTDDNGNKHFYVVYGYQQQPPEIAAKSYRLTILVLAIVVVVVFVGLLMGIDRMIDPPTWGASLLAFAAAVALISFFLSALQVEQETGVEVFSQSLPTEVEGEFGSRFAALLPRPATWAAEILRDLWSACRELYAVSIRR